MRVLIIGGTGKISTAITRYLLERGESVVHYNRGRQPAPEGVATVIGDRTDHASFEAQMREAAPCDCVVDMMGYTPEDAASCLRAFGGRTGHLIFCSTVDVYARPPRAYPIREDEALGGRNTYGRNKVVCEQILMAAHERGELPVTVFRPAATYSDEGWLCDSFASGTRTLDRLRRGRPVIVHGDGQSLWVATHRDDVGPPIARAAGDPRTFGRAYNVAGEEWFTWDRYYQLIAGAMGAPPPTLVHLPTDLLAQVSPSRAAICAENFQFNNVFDNAAARNDLGFAYTVPFVDGARRIIAWLDAHGGLDNSDDDPLYDRVLEAWARLGEAMVRELSEAGGR